MPVPISLFRGVRTSEPAPLLEHRGSAQLKFLQRVDADGVLGAQGQLADCSAVAVLQALSYVEKDLANQRLVRMPNGNLGSLLFEKQGSVWVPKPVVVDRDLYVDESGRARYAQSPDLWLSFMEKALAALYGSYAALEKRSAADILGALFGCDAATLPSRGTTPAKMAETMRESLAHERPVVACTLADSRLYAGRGLIAFHVYLVLGTKSVNGELYVELHNPWGHTEPPGSGANDGTFLYPMSKFLLDFAGIAYATTAKSVVPKMHRG